MFITIALVAYLNNGKVQEKEQFVGRTETVDAIYKKCEKAVGSNEICALKQELDNAKGQVLYTDLKSMDQFYISKDSIEMPAKSK